MDWYLSQYVDGTRQWACHYRGNDLAAVEVSPSVVNWSAQTTDGVSHVGSSVSIVLAKRAAESVIRPRTRTTAQFSRMRRAIRN